MISFKTLIFRTLYILPPIILVFLFMSYQPMYRGPLSDHFDGRRFFYKGSAHTFTGMVRWLWEMETVEWPSWIIDPPQPKPVEQTNDGELRVTYINHATVLIQMDGLNILTDPIWSERAGPLSWLGSKRVRSPGVKMEDLPGIDVILISHDHYDHLDLTTMKHLNEKYTPQILVGLGVKPILKDLKSDKIVELDWWQDYNYEQSGMKFIFVPAKHGSGRSLWGDNKTLWGGFVMEGKNGRVYYAGDTGYEDFLDSIKNRFGSFRLTILPIGSYEKRWYMKTQHMNPEDAVRAHKLLQSNQSVGFHFGTFLEHPEQTINAHAGDLSSALKKYDIPETDFWILKFGEGRNVP